MTRVSGGPTSAARARSSAGNRACPSARASGARSTTSAHFSTPTAWRPPAPGPAALLEATRDVLTLARERFAVRDYHGAVLLLTEAARERPLYADALNLLGLSLAMIDRTQEALQAFDDALERNPRYIEALLNRAVLLTQLGRHDDAREAYARAEELGRPDESGFPAVVANRLANRHAALRDEYRAAGWLDAMLLRGLAFYLQGDLDEAGRMWDRASARHPEEPRLEIYRSMLARRRGGDG